jgi:hypothetical protein
MTTARRPEGDDGVALFAALMVVAISSSLILIILGYAVSAARDSGRDRGRSIAVATVEGVVDSTYAALQTGTPANMPCNVVPTQVLAAGPDGSSAQATVRYMVKKADGTTLVTADCMPAGYAPKDVVGAVITATGNTAARAGSPAGKRKMESHVKLTPVYAQDNSLGKAIYASGSLAVTNNATLLGNVGSDADVYAGQTFVCDNSLDLAGSLYVQGNTTFSNTCSVKGDLHSLGSVTINNQSTIGGRIISSSGTTGVALNHPNITAGGVVQAAGGITGDGSWGSCVQPKCQRNLSPAPPPPPNEPFPILQWDAATQAAWLAAGYTNVVTRDDCTESGGLNSATRWLRDEAHLLTAKSVLLTDCAIKLSGEEIKLKQDLAILAKGGFQSTNSTEFASTASGTPRHLHWVVPFDTVARPCTTPQISTSQQFRVTDDVRMFLYSPCDISFSNQSTQIGQIYGGGNVTVNNRFTLQFRPVPVFGVQLPVSSTVVESFKVDIVYKRETG